MAPSVAGAILEIQYYNKATRSPEISRQQVQKRTYIYILDIESDTVKDVPNVCCIFLRGKYTNCAINTKGRNIYIYIGYRVRHSKRCSKCLLYIPSWEIHQLCHKHKRRCHSRDICRLCKHWGSSEWSRSELHYDKIRTTPKKGAQEQGTSTPQSQSPHK